jgi:hypothetical protein
MEFAAIGGDGARQTVVSEHMDLMIAPIQLARERSLGRTVSAAVPVHHENPQPPGAFCAVSRVFRCRSHIVRHARSPNSLLMMPMIEFRTSC